MGRRNYFTGATVVNLLSLHPKQRNLGTLTLVRQTNDLSLRSVWGGNIPHLTFPSTEPFLIFTLRKVYVNFTYRFFLKAITVKGKEMKEHLS